jgi:hypothetical protein
MAFLRLVPLLSVCGLAACIGPLGGGNSSDASTSPPAAPHVLRIVVKVPSMGLFPPEQIVRETMRISGMQARYVSVVGNYWHSVALTCPDILSCNTAVERLEVDTSVFESVQRDARKQPL